MRICRINEVSLKGDFISKCLVSEQSGENWYDKLQRLLKEGKPIPMRWNPGGLQTQVLDLIPSTACGLVMNEKAFIAMSNRLGNLTTFKVNVEGGDIFYGILPKNFTDQKNFTGKMDKAEHVLTIVPKHCYIMVSEAFKNEWERNGFTGAEFQEIMELDNSLFNAL